MNSSLREGYTPDTCTMMYVALGKYHNYAHAHRGYRNKLRPIALTPNLSKLLEYPPCSTYMCKTFRTRGRPNSIWSSERKFHNTRSASIASPSARLLFVDFTKAFDHIHHHTRLGNYGKMMSRQYMQYQSTGIMDSYAVANSALSWAPLHQIGCRSTYGLRPSHSNPACKVCRRYNYGRSISQMYRFKDTNVRRSSWCLWRWSLMLQIFWMVGDL